MSDQILNTIENFCKKTSEDGVNTFNKYASDKQNKSIENFHKRANLNEKKATLELNTPNKKFNKKTNQTKEVTLTVYITSLDKITDEIGSLHAADILAFFKSLLKNMIDSIKKFASAIIAKLGDFVNDLVNSINAMVVGFITSITNMLTALYESAIAAFNELLTKLNNMKNIALNAIKKAKNLLNQLGAIKPKEVINNFFEREVGQSSLSKLTQVNVKNLKGAIKVDKSVLKITPATKILLPKLKFDINKTLTFKPDPISKLLGFTPILIPTLSSTKIEEPKPTDDKAEYGKIQVKENKAGFQEISDETPGNVRKVNMHPSGTYNSMLDDGSSVNKVTGDKVEVNDKNWNIKTDKDKIEIIVGDSKIEIRKNLIQNIQEDVNVNVGGDYNSVIEGNVNDNFKSDYDGKIDGDYSESVEGDRTEKTGGDLTEKVNGNYKSTVTGSLTITVTGNINIISSGSTNITSSGATNIVSGGKVKISAPKIELG